jgi:hypothetical protein
MARQELLDPDGNCTEVEEGEVARVTVTFEDYDAASLALANILSLTLTLRNAEDDSIINSRNAQSILNANGGTVVDVSGVATLTLILDEDDNANVGGVLSGVETHWLDLTWTWDDGTAVRTGKASYYYDVRVLDSPTMDVDWLG